MTILFSLLVLFFSIVLHEIAHGSMALQLGDQTAKNAGRLTLNPIKHIDLFGTILLPLMLLMLSGGAGPIFGWAKPVPINPFNFRDQKWGTLKVSLAGPAMNFLVALFFGLIIRFLPLPLALLDLFSIIVLYNFAWGIFNLLPLPPLDGSHILFALLPEKLSHAKLFLTQYGFFFLIFFVFWGIKYVFLAAAVLYYFITRQPFLI